MKFGNVMISVVVILVILIIIVPLSPFMLDALLMSNITISLVILLITLYTKEPLQFSAFPPLLLIVTIYRLALNISSTRLILSNGGDAGNVIHTFGNFVIGSNLVVGIIIFVIIIIIQFVVITKGSERVAEVAARFTLDAMPGKQMAIDADLNTGIINEEQARERRTKIQREADFYGAMDGAGKFVKGDAIVSIIIVVVNIAGGIIIGVTSGGGMALEEVFRIYTLATVGEGLVNQLPALLVSTATGIIVTRAASENNLSIDLTKQILAQPLVLMIAGGAIASLGLIPGLPTLPIFGIAGLLLWQGYTLNKRQNAGKDGASEDDLKNMAAEARKPENVVSLLNVDPIELEFGYSIIPLADAAQGGDLLDRVVMIRRQCALDLGIIVPVIRLRDNMQLNMNEYVIKIKGFEVSRGLIRTDCLMAISGSGISGQLQGIETIEPAFGIPALWINTSDREMAESLGYTIVDPPSVIATHLSEILKRHAYELLDRQQVQNLISNLKQTQPALVDEVVPKMFSLGEVQKVLANLLRESISIRDIGTIIETMGEYGGITRDIGLITEYVRQSLKRGITSKFITNNKARVITLDSRLEQLIAEKARQGDGGSYVALEPDVLRNMYSSLKGSIEKLAAIGATPIVLTSPAVRMHFKKLVEQKAPDLVVLSYNELDQKVEIYSEGLVSV